MKEIYLEYTSFHSHHKIGLHVFSSDILRKVDMNPKYPQNFNQFISGPIQNQNQNDIIFMQNANITQLNETKQNLSCEIFVSKFVFREVFIFKSYPYYKTK